MKGKQDLPKKNTLSLRLYSKQSSHKPLLLILLMLGMGWLFVPNSIAQQNQLGIGSRVKVSTNGAHLNLRESPTTEAGIIAVLDAETILTVIGGPEFANDFEWWHLQGESTTGWAASRFLTPLSNEEEGDAPQVAASEADINADEPVAPLTPLSEEGNASDPEANNISGADPVVPRINNSYGFSKICFLNWRYPSGRTTVNRGWTLKMTKFAKKRFIVQTLRFL